MHAADSVRLGVDWSPVREVVARLRSTYGRRSPHLNPHPTDELIATILSQNTSDINSGRAFEALQARFSTWEEVASVDPETLAVGSSRVDLQACKLEYSIVSPK